MNEEEEHRDLSGRIEVRKERAGGIGVSFYYSLACRNREYRWGRVGRNRRIVLLFSAMSEWGDFNPAIEYETNIFGRNGEPLQGRMREV
jgi:hypothetical protein